MILMAMDGYSDVEMRRELCLANGKEAKNIVSTWYALKERDREFNETLIICKQFQEAWWIGISRTSINKQFFQHASWFANMKNRFGWRDKTEIEHGLTDETFERYRAMTPADIGARLVELGIPASK